MFVNKLYPKAHQGRKHGNDPSFTSNRGTFFKAAFTNFALLQVLFLGLFCYIFGSIFQQTPRIHNLGILFVDYDGGAIGNSVRAAYKSLQSDAFPTLIERPATEFTVGSLREEVCQTRYWATLYISPGASNRLETALSGSTAASYNRSDAMTFIWNEARYSAIVDSNVAANLRILSSTAKIIYTTNGTIQQVSTSNPAAVSVFANPWTLTDLNIKVTVQGARVVYNTLVIILILIQEFFYLGTINALYGQFQIYTHIFPHRIIAYRTLISMSYTFVGSLCTTGVIWAFRAGWDVNYNQFALCWAILWLFAHANFLCLDVFTVWIPAQFMPMALITWMMFNVASILVPFELSPRFYRWAYAMPAHEAYEVLTDIWSGGCNPKLHYALPILFSLEIVSFTLSAMGVYRRCHYAILAEEAQEEAFKEKIAAAVSFERKKEQEREQEREEEKKGKSGSGEGEGDDEIDAAADVEAGEREELAEVIKEEESIIQRRQSNARAKCEFGPSFGVSAYQEKD